VIGFPASFPGDTSVTLVIFGALAVLYVLITIVIAPKVKAKIENDEVSVRAALSEHERSLAAHKLFAAENYVGKGDFKDVMADFKSRLIRIEDLLNTKADKRGS